MVILSDKKLAALLRLLPQDASGVFKDRREPDSIGIVMPVGWAETGAPENGQEHLKRAGRRAGPPQNLASGTMAICTWYLPA